MIPLHQALASAVKQRHGISTVFGVAGDANLFFIDSFVRVLDGAYIAATTEATAVQMACGFAMATGRVGVATVTHGPGLTNTVTSLVDAVRSRTPIVLIAGDVPSDAVYHLQRIDQGPVVRATGAEFIEFDAAGDYLDALDAAMRLADERQTPVVLSIPVSLQWEDVPEPPTALIGPGESEPSPIDPQALDSALGILASARKPVVLAGRGAATSREAILRLAHHIGAPLATTLRGSGLFASEANNLGVFGTLSAPSTLEAINQSDAIIAFGASLNQFTTVERSLVDKKRVVACDLVPEHLAQVDFADARLQGNAGDVADRLRDELADAGIATTPPWWRPNQSVYAERPASHTPHDRLRTGTAIAALDNCIPENAVVAFDGGRFLYEAWPQVRIGANRTLIHTVSFGAIGLGLGHAIGASMADKSRPTVLVVGDGGFMLGGIADLTTIATHNLNFTIVVVNDQAYGAEYIQFVNRNMDPQISQFTWPSFAAIAASMGLRSITVTTPEDLVETRSLFDTPGPSLIELVVEP